MAPPYLLMSFILQDNKMLETPARKSRSCPAQSSKQKSHHCPQTRFIPSARERPSPSGIGSNIPWEKRVEVGRDIGSPSENPDAPSLCLCAHLPLLYTIARELPEYTGWRLTEEVSIIHAEGSLPRATNTPLTHALYVSPRNSLISRVGFGILCLRLLLGLYKEGADIVHISRAKEFSLQLDSCLEVLSG